MPPTITLPISELVRQFRVRGVTLEVDGSDLLVSPRSLLTDNDRVMIREHKREMLECLRESDGAWQSERLRLPDEPCDVVEPWDRSGLGNLLAVARRAGFRFGGVESELSVCGQASATELWRLIREQATGLSRLLRDGV